MGADADVRRLLDIEAIRNVHARYFRFLDDRKADEMRNLFTADARIESSSRTFEDREDFVAFLAEPNNRPRWTVHHGHMPEVELIDERRARVTWQLAAHGGYDDGKGGERVIANFGRYHGELRNEQDGQWRYSWLRLTLHPHRLVLDLKS